MSTPVDKDAQILRLQRALDAATDVGIYPMAYEGMYEKRTDYMNGWNAHATEALLQVTKVLQDGDWENVTPK